MKLYAEISAVLTALAMAFAALAKTYKFGPFLEESPVPQEKPQPHVDLQINDETMLEIFCKAIRDYEGKPGDLSYRNNNPGNARCSKVGYLPKYGNVKCANNFSVFPTWELGWEYLMNMVHYRAHQHPHWTILDFFSNYSPPSDGNDPNKYAYYVATRCGRPVDCTLAELFGTV